jgi:hypothetical protein
MFCLNRDDFRRRDEAQLAGFVICWERYYRGSVPVSPTDATLIDYEAELNIQGALTDQNVARLLRWKDPRMLTHPKVDGTNNHRVENVLAQLDAINQFRNGILDQQAFAQTTAGIFPNGIVWQLFLFHIARPWEWPIADQHVFRAHAVLFDQPAPQTLADFEQYRNNFAQLAQALPDIHNGSRVDIVRRNKRLDDALMSYGQFLLAYDR